MARLAVLFFAFSSLAFSQAILTSVAGTDWLFPGNNKKAAGAPVGSITAVTQDPDGNPVFCSPKDNMVLRLNRDGTLTVIAGNGLAALSGDGGPATAAALNGPKGLVYDSQSNLYIADTSNHRIRKVTPDGKITTFAGTNEGESGDGGPAAAARLDVPRALAFDRAGNLYIADQFNYRIRRVDSSGNITTYAGTGQPSTAALASVDNPTCTDGPAQTTRIGRIEGLWIDTNQNLYLADADSHCVRRVGRDGSMVRVAGQASGLAGYTADGAVSLGGRLDTPSGIAVDSSGNLYIAETGNGIVRLVDPRSGLLTTLAGKPANQAAPTDKPLSPTAITVDARGASGFIASEATRVLSQFTRSGTGPASLTAVAGGGTFQPVPPGTDRSQIFLNGPNGLAFDRNQNLYIADQSNNRVLKMSPDGKVSVFAGNGDAGSGIYGRPATDVPILDPAGIAVDAQGNVYIAHPSAHIVTKVATNGILTRFAGTGEVGTGGDNVDALQAPLQTPVAVAADTQGNVYIAESCTVCVFQFTLTPTLVRVRKVTPDGLISTFSGSRSIGAAGDGLPFQTATYNSPKGLVFDSKGNLYVADSFGGFANRIRKIDLSSGVISTIAGSGSRKGRSADGFPATEASLGYPVGLAVDAADNLYFTDVVDHLVRRISGGILTTIAGTGQPGFAGDGGPAANARLNKPQGVAVDRAGNVLIADGNNNRLRMVLAASPTFDTDTSSLTLTAPSGGAVTSTQPIGLLPTLVGLGYTVNTSNDWLRVTSTAGAMPATIGVSADPSSLPAGTVQGTITITAPGARVPDRSVAVTFNVTASLPPQMIVSQTTLDFSLPPGGTATSSLQVKNLGGGTLDFTVADTNQTPWLTLGGARTVPAPGTPAQVDATIQAANLAPGTYGTQIAITGPGPQGQSLTIQIPVTVSITETRPRILLAQNALRFVAVAGGGNPLPRNFGLLNAGAGALDFTVESSTLAGGDAWLKSSSLASSVPSGPGNAAIVKVEVAPAGLSEGDYYGFVRLKSSSAVNSPQIVPVLLSVLPAGATPGPELDRSSVLFSSVPGASPGAETVLLANLGKTPLTYNLARPAADTWLTVAPNNGTIQPGEFGRILVQPDYTNLTPGVLQSSVAFQFSDGNTRSVDVIALAASASSDPSKLERDAACDVRTLTPTFNAPKPFLAPANAPVALRLQVYDNCGNPFLDPAAHVLAVLFDSSGKSLGVNTDVQFTPVGGGEWQGTLFAQPTWGPSVRLRGVVNRNNLSGVTNEKGSDLTAIILPAGTVVPPILTKGATQNSATLQNSNLVAPGGLITIRGSGFSETIREAKGLPLPYDADGTQVFLQGRQLALLYTSDGQINAQVPFDLTVNAPQQLIVQRKATLMLNPETLNVAPAQPGILAVNEAGTGQGFVYVLNSDGSRTLADASTPAKAGDRIVILAAGLGTTSPAIDAGQRAPDNPRATVINPPSVTIGGVPAVLESATLSPDSDKSGRYEIVCTVPAGLAPGSEVPLVLLSAGQSSPAAVTMAIR